VADTLTLSDTLRDAPGAIPAPAEAPGGAPAPESAPSVVGAPPSPFGQVASDVLGARGQWWDAAGRAREALAEKSAAMEAPIAAAEEQLTAPQPLPPPPPVFQAPPSRGLTPFLAPVEGEAPETSISKLIQAIGLFATGIAGAAKGDARAGLAALKGAMEGWAVGDKDRADRSFADWRAKTDAALQQWGVERQSYLDIMAAANLSLEQKFKLLQLAALKGDNKVVAAMAEKGDLAQLTNWLTAESNHADAVRLTLLKIVGSKEGKDVERALKGIPSAVQGELMGNAGARALIEQGTAPTPDMVKMATEAVEKRDYDKKLQVARETGLIAAGIPQRTPTESMKRLEDIALARSTVAEMGRLFGNVRQEVVLGGIRPWINNFIETGRIGPFPISTDALGKLTPDERRFLAVTRRYADDVLRLKSGAAINEQEFARMLQFLTDPSITPQSFQVRLQLEDDSMRARAEATKSGLAAGGYRAPDITPPTLAPTAAPYTAPIPAGLPDAKGYAGKPGLKSSKTGKVYFSDGVRWHEKPPAPTR